MQTKETVAVRLSIGIRKRLKHVLSLPEFSRLTASEYIEMALDKQLADSERAISPDYTGFLATHPLPRPVARGDLLASLLKERDQSL